MRKHRNVVIMIFFKQNEDNESVSTNNPNEALRAFIPSESLVKAKIIAKETDAIDVNHTKLVAMKTRLNFQGDIVASKNGSGVVIHRNPKQEKQDFDIDAYLATSV